MSGPRWPTRLTCCAQSESLRFLIDENLPGDVQSVLEAAGHDVLYVPWSRFRASPDSVIRELAVQDSRIVVTADLGFRVSLEPRPSGFVLLRLPNAGRREIADFISDLLKAPEFTTLEGSVTIVTRQRI